MFIISSGAKFLLRWEAGGPGVRDHQQALQPGAPQALRCALHHQISAIRWELQASVAGVISVFSTDTFLDSYNGKSPDSDDPDVNRYQFQIYIYIDPEPNL